jgi:hypothetical protein
MGDEFKGAPIYLESHGQNTWRVARECLLEQIEGWMKTRTEDPSSLMVVIMAPKDIVGVDGSGELDLGETYLENVGYVMRRPSGRLQAYGQETIGTFVVVVKNVKMKTTPMPGQIIA